MYSLSLFVNPFLVSRSHFVRFVDDSLTVFLTFDALTNARESAILYT